MVFPNVMQGGIISVRCQISDLETRRLLLITLKEQSIWTRQMPSTALTTRDSEAETLRLRDLEEVLSEAVTEATEATVATVTTEEAVMEPEAAAQEISAVICGAWIRAVSAWAEICVAVVSARHGYLCSSWRKV